MADGATDIFARLQRAHDTSPRLQRGKKTPVEQPVIPGLRPRECRYDGCGATPLGDSNSELDLCHTHLGKAWNMIRTLNRMAAA